MDKDTEEVQDAQDIVSLEYAKVMSFPCLLRDKEGNVFMVSSPDPARGNMHHVTLVSIVRKERMDFVAKTAFMSARELKASMYPLPIGHQVILTNAAGDGDNEPNTDNSGG